MLKKKKSNLSLGFKSSTFTETSSVFVDTATVFVSSVILQYLLRTNSYSTNLKLAQELFSNQGKTFCMSSVRK